MAGEIAKRPDARPDESPNDGPHAVPDEVGVSGSPSEAGAQTEAQADGQTQPDGVDTKPLAGIAFLKAYPTFTRLWLGQLVSRFGDSLDTVAFIWLVLELTGSTLLMGTLMVVNMLPSILLNPFTGVWVDRLRRRPVMIVSDTARAFTTGIVAVLYLTGNLEVWHLYLVTALNSTGEAFAVPARMAVMPQVVQQKDLVSANSLGSISSSFASLFGLLLAAPVFQFLGIACAIGVDAGTFLFAALTAVGAAIPERRRTPAVQDAAGRTLTGALSLFFGELREGLRLVTTQRVLLYLVLLAGLANFALGPLEVLLPVHVKKVLGMEVAQLSQVYLVYSAGTLVSGYLTMRIARQWPEAVLVLVGLSMMGFGYAALYFGRDYASTLFMIMVMGLGQAPAQAGLQTAIQRRTPAEAMGRVSGLLATLAMSAMPLSMAVTGAVAEVVAAPIVFGLFGLLFLVATISILSRPVFGLGQALKQGAIVWRRSSG